MEKEIRKAMAALARNPKTRRVGGIGRPCKWSPETVIDPETGCGMTDGAAWFSIAESLENEKIKMKEIKLKKPPGATGYVFKVPHKAEKKLYIKVELIASVGLTIICARSFHY